jgi:hypothetical protein
VFGDLCKLKYELNVALLDYALENKTFELHWDRAQELQGIMNQMLMPWLEHQKGPSRQEVRDMAKMWEKVFGDPRDPAVAARIETTARALRSMAEKNKPRSLVD